MLSTKLKATLDSITVNFDFKLLLYIGMAIIAIILIIKFSCSNNPSTNTNNGSAGSVFVKNTNDSTNTKIDSSKLVIVDNQIHGNIQLPVGFLDSVKLYAVNLYKKQELKLHNPRTNKDSFIYIPINNDTGCPLVQLNNVIVPRQDGKYYTINGYVDCQTKQAYGLQISGTGVVFDTITHDTNSIHVINVNNSTNKDTDSTKIINTYKDGVIRTYLLAGYDPIISKDFNIGGDIHLGYGKIELGLRPEIQFGATITPNFRTQIELRYYIFHSPGQ